MRRVLLLALAAVVLTCFSIQTSFAQLRIKVPGIPKSDKSKPPQSESNSNQTTPATRADSAERKSAGTTGRGQKIYTDLYSNSTPRLVKDSIYIQAKTHDSYWKLQNQSNYSSCVPKLRFELFYNNRKEINLVAEYTNPDGSAWFTDELEHDTYAPAPETGTVRYSSKDIFQTLETKSTTATGVYGIKIKNRDTGEVVFQGKFRVNKFGWDDDPRQKNKFDFFVEHDWLLPIGYVGFGANQGFDIGAQPVEVGVWLKGDKDRGDVEARLFYNGKQVATTKSEDGLATTDSATEVTTEHSVYTADVHNWRLWHFQWQKTFIYDNGGEFNHDNFPNAFFADKNPGQYTVKVFYKGAQIRELNFAIGADGRIADAGYAKPHFLAQYRVIVPVKIVGPEKWDAASWKTDAFYGNPLNGFIPPQ
jgi:hypothetical protein